MASQNQKQENSSYFLTPEELEELDRDGQEAMEWLQKHPIWD